MYEVKTKLSQLVTEALAGKQVILMNRNEPVVMVVPILKTRVSRKLGFLKGKLMLQRGWDAPIEDFVYCETIIRSLSPHLAEPGPPEVHFAPHVEARLSHAQSCQSFDLVA